MTRRQDLERSRHSLGEIREIMNSMKTLAYMETRKLARFLDAQHGTVVSIEHIAADFLGFHSETLPEADVTSRLYLLIGTERGFCGDFNQVLVHQMESTLAKHPTGSAFLIAVGRRLCALLEHDPRMVARIDGASVAEEVSAVLNQMVNELSALQERHGIRTLYAMYHGHGDQITTQELLPPFQAYLHQPPLFPHPPVLNLSPTQFLVELTEQYLFAVLHEILYTSQMAENNDRVAHLEGAVKYLEDKSDELARQCNALRQEEIIEEIEVILLNSGGLDEHWRKRK